MTYPNTVISMPSQLFTMRSSFKAVANGSVYIGEVDTDPTIPTNQIQVYIEQENGTLVPVAQPIKINSAGFLTASGQVQKFVLTNTEYSMAVLNAYGVQEHYFPRVYDQGISAALEVEERVLGVGVEIYRGKNGQHVENGDVIPSKNPPYTHLIIPINGKNETVAMSPVSSGAVADLTETSATIGGTAVTLIVGIDQRYIGLLEAYGVVDDGVTDNSNAIKSAMSSAYGKTLTCHNLDGTILVDPTTGFIPVDKSIDGVFAKTTIKRKADSAGNMLIFRDSTKLSNLIIDGNKDENTSDTSSDCLNCTNRTNTGLTDVTLANAPRDGLRGDGVNSATYRNVKAVGNLRNGASFVDNCTDLHFIGWKTKDNGLVGLDLEPNSTVQSNISIIDYESDNDGLSIQGGASTAYNSKVTLDNIRILNNSLLNMNRVVGVSGGTIFVDYSSEITIEKQASTIYGLTDGDINIVKEGVPLNASNKILNGGFNAAGSSWSVNKSTGATVEFTKNTNAQFGEYSLHTANALGEYAFAQAQVFDVTATQYFCAGVHIRAISGRPYMLVRFRDDANATVSEHKLAGPINPENRWRRPFMMFRVPDGATNVLVLCGGDVSEASEGYFDGAFYYQNSTKTRFDVSDNYDNMVSYGGSAPPTSGTFSIGWRHYPIDYIESGGVPVSYWIRKTAGSSHVIGTDWIVVKGS